MVWASYGKASLKDLVSDGQFHFYYGHASPCTDYALLQNVDKRANIVVFGSAAAAEC